MVVRSPLVRGLDKAIELNRVPTDRIPLESDDARRVCIELLLGGIADNVESRQITNVALCEA